MSDALMTNSSTHAAATVAPHLSYKLRHTLLVHDKAVASVKFSPDGRVIASGSSDRTIHLSSTARGRSLCSLEGHSQGISDVSWSCDGGFLVSGSDDATVRIWDIDTVRSGKECRSTQLLPVVDGYLRKGREACSPFRGHTNFVFCVDFSPRGNLVASGSFDESLRLWDVRSGGICLRVIPAHSEPITSCQFIGDGTVLMTSSYDGLMGGAHSRYVHLMQRDEGLDNRSFNAKRRALRYRAPGTIVRSFARETRLWDVATGQCLKTLQQEGVPPIACARFSPNNKFCLVSSLDGRLRVVDYLSSVTLKSYIGHTPSKLCSTAGFAPVLSTSISSSKAVSSSSSPSASSSPVPPAAVYSGGDDGCVTLWDVSTRQILQKIEAHSDGGAPCLAVDASSVAPILVTGGGGEGDKTVKIWVDEGEGDV